LGRVQQKHISYFRRYVKHHDGALIESGLYDQAMVAGKEANGEEIRAMWKSLNEFGAGKSILYPDGLLELLR